MFRISSLHEISHESCPYANFSIFVLSQAPYFAACFGSLHFCRASQLYSWFGTEAHLVIHGRPTQNPTLSDPFFFGRQMRIPLVRGNTSSETCHPFSGQTMRFHSRILQCSSKRSIGRSEDLQRFNALLKDAKFAKSRFWLCSPLKLSQHTEDLIQRYIVMKTFVCFMSVFPWFSPLVFLPYSF